MHESRLMGADGFITVTNAKFLVPNVHSQAPLPLAPLAVMSQGMPQP